jgi:hypothetical protein
MIFRPGGHSIAPEHCAMTIKIRACSAEGGNVHLNASIYVGLIVRRHQKFRTR